MVKDKTRRSYDDSRENREQVLIFRSQQRSSSVSPIRGRIRSLSIGSNESVSRPDYDAYREYHSRAPTPPRALSPPHRPRSPLFGQGGIPRDEPGPWFRQNHQPEHNIAYSERGNAGSKVDVQPWWDDNETETSVGGEHRTYVDVRDELEHDAHGRPERFLVVEETTRNLPFVARTVAKAFGRKSKRS